MPATSSASQKNTVNGDGGLLVSRRYTEAGTHPFMDEVHIRALTFDYIYNWAILTRDWADRTESEVTRWRNLRQTPRKRRRAVDRIRGIAKIRS